MGNYTSSQRLNWVVTVGDRTYHVALQHNSLSGWREVFIDSKSVFANYDRSFSDIELNFSASNTPSSPSASSDENDKFRVTIKNNQYKIILADGRYISDLLSSFPKGEAPDITTDVTSYEVTTINSEIVAYFKMQSTINGVKYSAKYRYKQFDSFHNRMQTTYAMSQSRYSIPNFPNKTVKLIYDHGQEHFLQDRLFFLSRYMRGIVCVPKANINPDLLQFLKGEWKTSTERKLEEQNQQ